MQARVRDELEKEFEFADFLSMCKQTLNVNGLRYHNAGKKVKKLAVMGGSGGSCIASDIKYNGFLDAKELGINLIDADHFCTENVIIPVLAEKLGKAFGGIEFVISEIHKQTVQFF